MVEFERALIQERVKAGLRNARAKGRRLGRPVVPVDVTEIHRRVSEERKVGIVAVRFLEPPRRLRKSRLRG